MKELAELVSPLRRRRGVWFVDECGRSRDAAEALRMAMPSATRFALIVRGLLRPGSCCGCLADVDRVVDGGFPVVPEDDVVCPRRR